MKTSQAIKVLLRVHLIGCWGVKLFSPKDCVKFFLLLQNLNCKKKIFWVFNNLNFQVLSKSLFLTFNAIWVWSFITICVCSLSQFEFLYFATNKMIFFAILGFKFCYNLSFWASPVFFFFFFLSFTILVFEFCQNLSF